MSNPIPGWSASHPNHQDHPNHPPRNLYPGLGQSQSQASLPTPSPSQQPQRTPYPARSSGLQQHPQLHNSPYSGSPYALSQQQHTPGPQLQNGNGVSAERQIALGVLGNSNASGTPQRRPPALGTQIHIHSPQLQPMSVNHAVNAPPQMNPSRDFVSQQRQSQTSSPALQGLNAQRPSMSGSPASSNFSQRPEFTGERPDFAQELKQATANSNSPQSAGQNMDMSLLDPQLAVDQHLADQSSSLMGQQPQPQPQQEAGSQSPQPDAAALGEMPPPPGGNYPTFEALFAAAQAHALSHGYAFVIGRSKRDNRGLKKVFLICDRGGTNKEKVPGGERQRKTKSRKCGCTFGVFGLENKTAWVLRGRIDGEHLVHNHPPSESPTEHPGARKLDPKAIAAVKALEENGVSVKDTLEILHRENPTVRFLPRDIYNARAAIKRDPSRVDATSLAELPTFYKKPPPTFEEKLRAELRTEVADAKREVEKVRQEWKAEVEQLREQLREKTEQIRTFEQFIDICNQRVIIRRSELADGVEGDGGINGG